MSKLPNAPLLEVIFELKWDIVTKSDFVDFQYLHGDLYSNLRNKYLYRESLTPPEVPIELVKGKPVYRFRVQQGGYPLVQIGPGVVTINTNDDNYYWEEFSKEVNNLILTIDKIYSGFSEKQFTPALTYIDFLEYNNEKASSLEYVNSMLNLSVEDNFMNKMNTTLSDLNFTMNYKIDDKVISLNLGNAKMNNDKPGFVLQTKVIGNRGNYSTNDIEKWLESAHALCSDLFKSLTKGLLYESFK